MKQLTEKLNENKYTLSIAFSVMFLLGFLSMLFQSASNVLLGVSVGFFTLLCVFLNVTNALSLMITMLPYLSFTFKFVEMSYFYWISSMFAMVFLIKYIIECAKGRKKVYIAPLVLSVAIVLFGFYNFNIKNILNFYSNLLILGSCYIIFCYYKEINVKKVCYHFVAGLILSIFLTCLVYLIKDARYLVVTTYDRLKFFCANPNYMQSQAIIALAIIVVAVFKYNLAWYYSIPASATICVAGFLTNSKTFLVLLCILALLYACNLITSKNRKNYTAIVVFVCVFTVVVLACSGYILDTIDRFGESGFDKVLDNIFTGRYSIWKMYLTEWASSPMTIFFGKGVCFDTLGIDTHSSYILLLFEYGLIGVLLIAGLIYAYITCADKNRSLSKTSFIPLVCFLLNIVEESFIGKKCAWLLILCIMVAFVPIEKTNEQTVKTKERKIEDGNKDFGVD